MTALNSDPMNRLIGSNIRFYRVRKGLSRVMLASRTDLSDSTLGAYEIGTRAITATELLRISRTLDLPIGQFFAGDLLGQLSPPHTEVL